MTAEVEMTEQLTVHTLRQEILQKQAEFEAPDEMQFEQTGRRFERAVRQLVDNIKKIVEQVPELKYVLEDEIEVFTTPAFPGRSMEIHDQRLRIVRGDRMLLFDPTAKALLSALGQIDVEATTPIPFMVDQVLYLIPGGDGKPARWGYRSVHNMSGPLAPFTQNDLLRMLQAVFAS
jgi:hypothetical protein